MVFEYLRRPKNQGFFSGLLVKNADSRIVSTLILSMEKVIDSHTAITVRNDWIVISALFILALALRLPYSSVVLAGDEAGTFLGYGGIAWSDLFFHYKDSNQHTLFTVLSRFSMWLFGDSEFAFRLPVLLAGALAIPLLYRVTFLLTGSLPASVLAACMLSLSTSHLPYSQDGRGYALSVFFALTLIYSSMRLIQTDRPLPWGVSIIIIGFCMVFTIPSNLYFLAAALVFYSILYVRTRGWNGFSVRKFIADSIPFAIMFVFALGYLLIIYPDLIRGLSIYRMYALVYEKIRDLHPSFVRFEDVLRFFISPWSHWLYVFLIYGFWRLRKEKMFFPFLSLFVIPLILIVASRLMGPPRTYFYCLPFVFTGVAHGITETTSIFSEYFFIFRGKGRFLATLATIGLMIYAIPSANQYYSERMNRKGTSFDEARQVLGFIDHETDPYDLVVFPYSDMVFRHFIEKRCAERMLRILREGRLNGILFASQGNVAIYDIPIGGIRAVWKPILEKQPYRLIREITNARIYRLDVDISRSIPFERDEDYENRLKIRKPGIEIDDVETPKIVGDRALAIRRSTDEDRTLTSDEASTVDITMDNALNLFVYARNYSYYGSSTFMLDDAVDPSGLQVALNGYSGIFEESDSSGLTWRRLHPYQHLQLVPDRVGEKFVWQIIFSLAPATKGQHKYLETIYLKKFQTYFDGFQSYILYPKSK